ncbi:MAG: phosphoribosylanthranilate isomerase [Planctomycetes bacterium]|nr:phosphoribosylanthranilate isomerase [Planctomycetota bacterium]
MSSLFHIKICGITSVGDAQHAARAGADAIGLNFYPGSKRFVSATQGAEIVAALPAGVAKVGVFVNATTSEVVSIVKQVGLNRVQLHGDEPPTLIHELAAQLPNTPIIKAFRIGPTALQPVEQYLTWSCTHGDASPPHAVLLDAAAPGEFGGTGVRFDWQLARQFIRRVGSDGPPLILAGGLTAENVAEAIAAVKPWGVDTASGVESSPGHKDPDKVTRFVAAARQAFEKAAAS